MAIVYWKKYKVQKEEHSIWEALRLLKKISLDSIPNDLKLSVYHLRALIYQAQKEYSCADSSYQKAMAYSDTPVALGSVLNDYASLFIERWKLKEAKDILLKARVLLNGNNEIEEAFNSKWLGILALIQHSYKDAQEYLEKAALVIREKELLRELAGIFFILADITKHDDFFKAAEYFSSGLNFERLSEEVKERDEKIIKFYLNSFFGSTGNTSGVG